MARSLAMKYSLKLIFGLFLFALCACHVEAKPWHGITPLKSTRDDVARVLNQSIPSDARTFKYDSDLGQVEFVFSGKGPYWHDCVRQLQPGTVLIISVMPKTMMRLLDLEIDETKLRKLEPTPEFRLIDEAYAEENEGLVVSTFKGTVSKIVYIATREDQPVCAEYYRDPRLFADQIECWLCPTIVVSSQDEADAGTRLIFSVRVDGALPPNTYFWTVSDGRIVEGQATDSIKVDTGGLAGKTIKATVEVGGLDSACNKSATNETRIKPRRN